MAVTYPISIDPRHERIRSLELAGMFRRLSPTITLRIVQRDLNRVSARIWCGDDDPTPDQNWREGRGLPVAAGMED